jgi:hypothetical protein
MKSEKAAARSGYRRRASKAKIVSGDDGRDHFNRQTRHIAMVTNIIVTGAHADIALEAARKIYHGTEPADIEGAFVQASSEFNKPRRSDTRPADLKGVLNWTSETAARTAAVREHGPPEKHARGPAGVLLGQTYNDPWCFLPQRFLDQLRQKYPLAMEQRHDMDFRLQVHRVVDAADKREYGSRLQGIVETEFERYLHEVHAKRVDDEAQHQQWMEERRRKETEAAQGTAAR